MMKKITMLILLTIATLTTKAQNKLLSSIGEYFDNSSGTWTKSDGSNYYYDTNNNLIEERDFRVNDNGQWENDGKIVYTYNTNNKVTEEVCYAWNKVTNQYEIDERATYKYVSNRLSEILIQEWINSSWVDEGKVSITYNTNNLPQTVIELFKEDSEWFEIRTTYTYNANNRLVSDVEEEWDGTQWVNSRKALYTYNSNNKLTTIEGADWDKFNNNWVADDENVFDYVLDTNGNRISSTESGYKTDYTYDTTQFMSSFAHPFKDKTGVDYFPEGFPYINKLLSEAYNSGGSRTTYNYNSTITLSTAKIEDATASINVYPNPTKAFLNIALSSQTDIDNVFVTDMTGRKLIKQSNTNQLNVQNLAKGIYVLEAWVGDQKETKKFVKE
jgi:hypothetical protein